MKIQSWQLRQRQSLALPEKVHFSLLRIEEWYNYYQGNVYVSFSGGKDSTVLLHLVRSLYPEVPAVFVDTGCEYPEVRAFVKTIKNVTWLKPKMSFKQVIVKYGYPVVSKIVAMGCDRYHNTKSLQQKHLRLHGGTCPTGKKQHRTIPLKWHFLIDAPFTISDRCCEVLKKRPFKAYEKSTGARPFIGVMTGDSHNRQLSYLKGGCNTFNNSSPNSTPIAIWKEDDIWRYIKQCNLKYSPIYDMGEKNTGCMYCCFGVHLEKNPNRFQRMKQHHPKIFQGAMSGLGLGSILDYINVKY